MNVLKSSFAVILFVSLLNVDFEKPNQGQGLQITKKWNWAPEILQRQNNGGTGPVGNNLLLSTCGEQYTPYCFIVIRVKVVLKKGGSFTLQLWPRFGHIAPEGREAAGRSVRPGLELQGKQLTPHHLHPRPQVFVLPQTLAEMQPHRLGALRE